MNDASAGARAIVRKDVATAAPSSSSLQHTTTLAPALTNSRAQPLPIPLLPPVTITTLSAYRRLVIWISVRPRTFWAEFREAGAAGCLLNPPACASIVATAGQSVQSLFSLTASPDSRRGI